MWELPSRQPATHPRRRVARRPCRRDRCRPRLSHRLLRRRRRRRCPVIRCMASLRKLSRSRTITVGGDNWKTIATDALCLVCEACCRLVRVVLSQMLLLLFCPVTEDWGDDDFEDTYGTIDNAYGSAPPASAPAPPPPAPPRPSGDGDYGTSKA